jgi:hypothetical protein
LRWRAAERFSDFAVLDARQSENADGFALRLDRAPH